MQRPLLIAVLILGACGGNTPAKNTPRNTSDRDGTDVDGGDDAGGDDEGGDIDAPDVTCGEWASSSVDEGVSGVDVPSGVVDDAGTVHVVYRTADGEVRYGRRTLTGNWATELIEADTGENVVTSYPFAIAVAGDGVDVAYMNVTDGTLVAAHRTTAGSWSTEMIDDNVNVESGLTLVIDDTLGRHLVFRRMNITAGYAYRTASGEWSSTTIETGQDDVRCPVLKVDAAGVAHLGCLQEHSEASITPSEAVYVRRDTPTSEFVADPAVTAQGTVHGASFAMDSAGGLHMVALRLEKIDYGYRAPGSNTWSVEEELSDNFYFGGQLRVDGEGTVHLVYVNYQYEIIHGERPLGGDWDFETVDGLSAQPSPSWDIAADGEIVIAVPSYPMLGLARKPAGGTWSTEYLYDGDGFSPRLALARYGQVHVLDILLETDELIDITDCE